MPRSLAETVSCNALDLGARAADVEHFSAPELSSETNRTGTLSDHATDAEAVAGELIALAADAEEPLDLINAAASSLSTGKRELGRKLLALARQTYRRPAELITILGAIRMLFGPDNEETASTCDSDRQLERLSLLAAAASDGATPSPRRRTQRHRDLQHMKDVVIDTNVLYSWLGLVANAKFPPAKGESLAKTASLHISTPTVMEVVRRYREDLASLQKCLEPLHDGRLKLVSIGFAPVTAAELTALRTAKNISAVAATADAIIARKIAAEVSLLTFLFSSILGGVLNGLLEQRGAGMSAGQREDLQRHTQALFASNIPTYQQVIEEALREGYKQDNPKKAIREVFSTLFVLVLRTSLVNLHAVKAGQSIVTLSGAASGVVDAIMLEVKNDPLLAELKANMDNPLTALDDPAYSAAIAAYLAGYRAFFSADPEFTKAVVESLVTRLKKVLTVGAKIDKNDAMDLLLTYALHLPGFLIVTLDGKLQSLLQLVDPLSHAFMVGEGIV